MGHEESPNGTDGTLTGPGPQRSNDRSHTTGLDYGVRSLFCKCVFKFLFRWTERFYLEIPITPSKIDRFGCWGLSLLTFTQGGMAYPRMTLKKMCGGILLWSVHNSVEWRFFQSVQDTLKGPSLETWTKGDLKRGTWEEKRLQRTIRKRHSLVSPLMLTETQYTQVWSFSKLELHQKSCGVVYTIVRLPVSFKVSV